MNTPITTILENELKESLAELRNTTVTSDQRVKVMKLSYDRVFVEMKERKGGRKIASRPTSESLSIDCDSQGHDSSADSGFSSPDSPVGPIADGFFGSFPKLSQRSPLSKKTPFERYSSESAFRQRTVSECVAGSHNRRGILKMPSVDDVTQRVKRVSICEEHNKLVTFNPSLSLDQQASKSKKNEKKRLQKQRKADEKSERGSSVDHICSDYEDEGENSCGGKRTDRKDSGFISDDEDDKICA